MSFVTIRHFTEADIPMRTALLRESRSSENPTGFAIERRGLYGR